MSRRSRSTPTAPALLVVLLAVAVIGGTGWAWSNFNDRLEAASGRPSVVSTVQSTPEVVEVITVSALSDSHVFNGNSWFRQTVESGDIDGVRVGEFASFPGGDTEAVRAGLSSVKGEDVVVVSAGTNDLLSAVPPAQVAESVQTLVRDADKRAGTVILSLVPPSAARPAEVKELNSMLTAWADQAGVPVLDVYSPVAAPDGSWKAGLSGDGVHANDRGAALMADAAMKRLPALLG